jgi:hypothetical protein
MYLLIIHLKFRLTFYKEEFRIRVMYGCVSSDLELSGNKIIGRNINDVKRID